MPLAVPPDLGYDALSVPMHPTQLLAAYDLLRQQVRLPGAIRRERPHLIRHDYPAGDGLIVYSELTADNAVEGIEEQQAFFRRQGQALSWMVYRHDTPAELGTLLAERGFTPQAAQAVLVLELQPLPALPEKTEHAVVRVLEPERLQAVASIQEQVWGEPPSPADMDRLAKRIGESPAAFFLYLAYVDGHPAATAHLSLHSPAAWAALGGAATLPAYRRRGLYRSLLLRRLRQAQQAGVRFLEAEASPMSQPALQAIGFVHITDCRLYDSPAQGS